MKWMTQEEVPDAFGPDRSTPTLTQTNWAVDALRAVDLVGLGGDQLAERLGQHVGRGRVPRACRTYAHELSHNLSHPGQLRQPVRRRSSSAAFTGMWDMMSRGTFNGPGGPHTRYLIPPTQGSALGSQHNIRNKRFLNFVTDADLLRLNRNGLAQSGIAVADVTAREVPHTAGEVAGVRDRARRHGRRQLDARATTRPTGAATACARRARRSPASTTPTRWRSSSRSARTPIDPGHGVLIITRPRTPRRRCGGASAASCGSSTRTRTTSTTSTSSGPTARRRWRRSATSASSTTARSTRAWTPAPPTSGPTSATACTSTSSTSAPTRRASCTTRSAVKSLDGAGPQTRGVALQAAPARRGRRRPVVDLHVPAQEHGRGGGDRPGAAPAGLRRRT